MHCLVCAHLHVCVVCIVCQLCVTGHARYNRRHSHTNIRKTHLWQSLRPSCAQLHTSVQIHSKQIMHDTPPRVQLLSLVRDVSDPIEQVESVLALVINRACIDAFQCFAHFHQQLGLAHACVCVFHICVFCVSMC